MSVVKKWAGTVGRMRACLKRVFPDQAKDIDAMSEQQVTSGFAMAIKAGKVNETDLKTGPDSNPKEKTVKTKTEPKKPDAKPAKKAVDVFRVKPESEKYSSKRTQVLDRKGNPLFSGGRPVEATSQKELALTGVWLKHMALKSPLYPGVQLNDHEKGLLAELMKGEWIEFDPSAGKDGSRCWWDKAAPARTKALLDDSTSGGLYANPLWFDQNVVLPALLQGELFPYVNVVEQPRGRTINTAKVGIPTATWGTAEGTAMTAFDTTALISQITGTVFPVSVYVEIGRDLMADADVADLGGIVQGQIGQRMQSELDKVIANGDGTTQPQGIFGASGTIAVSSDNGNPGPQTVSDAESLIFAIGKQYRQAPYTPFFVMNDTSYRRFSGLPVSGTDERRVFGTNMIGGTQTKPMYKLFDHEVKIQNDLANGKWSFLPGQAYRLWRRMGFETQLSNEGNYFMTRNLTGLIVRGRFAGKIVLPEAVAVCTDGQS